MIDGPQFDQIGEERDQLALNRRLERRFIRRGWREMNPREVRHDRQNVVDENVRLLEKARALAKKTQLEGKTLPANRRQRRRESATDSRLIAGGETGTIGHFPPTRGEGGKSIEWWFHRTERGGN